MPEAAAVTKTRSALAAALAYWRWCWECGARLADCRDLGHGRKCCPDCRHHDPADALLSQVLAQPKGAGGG